MKCLRWKKAINVKKCLNIESDVTFSEDSPSYAIEPKNNVSMRYLILAVLALSIGTVSVSAQNYGKDVRKIERKAKKLARQAGRLGNKGGDYAAICATAADIERSARQVGYQADRMGRKSADRTIHITARDAQRISRDCKEMVDNILESLSCCTDGSYRPQVRLDNKNFSADLKHEIAALPGDTRRKIRRELKKLPSEVRNITVIRTMEDILSHPKKYRLN